MTKQIIFILILLITLGVFFLTMRKIYRYFSLTKPYPVSDFGKRFKVMFTVAIAQTKIFRFPVIGFIHAMVFWGFLWITLGSLEIVFDGILGVERLFSSLGFVYDGLVGIGDFFAWFILAAILIFLSRRIFIRVERFYGEEMKPISKLDANAALTIILLLMVSLIGVNLFYLATNSLDSEGWYPLSAFLLPLVADFSSNQLHFWHEFFWWSHILLIFIFANILPYSKHFHVFMSIPNVFFSRLMPLGHMQNMDSITREVKLMMDPATAFSAPPDESANTPSRFGVKDIEDINWKNYMDALSCTECGRCTSVCPANLTGKRLSPRKIMIDVRARMKEKGPGLVKDGLAYSDQKSLIRDYISSEELWACTTCNACAQECPININQPAIILDMRRYLVLEESAAPSGLNAMFSNIENNGAPWKYSPADRMKWSEDLYLADK
jgi:heterodisulfide reductase subunit C